jgi:hypothetical protein
MSKRRRRRIKVEVDNQIHDIRTVLEYAAKARKLETPAPECPVSPIVEHALQLLCDEINVSTGLSHLSDRNKAKELLCRLHDAGEPLNGDGIVHRARQLGWQDRDARDLGALAEQIAGGSATDSATTSDNDNLKCEMS